MNERRAPVSPRRAFDFKQRKRSCARQLMTSTLNRSSIFIIIAGCRHPRPGERRVDLVCASSDVTSDLRATQRRRSGAAHIHFSRLIGASPGAEMAARRTGRGRTVSPGGEDDGAGSNRRDRDGSGDRESGPNEAGRDITTRQSVGDRTGHDNIQDSRPV